MKSWYCETTDINKCASELYQCSVWFSLNALNFTKAARAGPDLALSCPECLTVKSVPQLHFFHQKMCERDCGEGSSVFHAVISEGRACLLITETSVTCSKWWIKKASSWLCIRTLASYQEDEMCFIKTTNASSHADMSTHACHPPTCISFADPLYLLSRGFW